MSYRICRNVRETRYIYMYKKKYAVYFFCTLSTDEKRVTVDRRRRTTMNVHVYAGPWFHSAHGAVLFNLHIGAARHTQFG